MIFWDDRVMAKGYRPVPRDQGFLLPPDLRDWLPPGHPVWLVIEVVDRHLDTSAVHALRRAGGAGAAGSEPGMLIARLVGGDAQPGTRSAPVQGPSPTWIAIKGVCAPPVAGSLTSGPV